MRRSGAARTLSCCRRMKNCVTTRAAYQLSTLNSDIRRQDSGNIRSLWWAHEASVGLSSQPCPCASPARFCDTGEGSREERERVRADEIADVHSGVRPPRGFGQPAAWRRMESSLRKNALRHTLGTRSRVGSKGAPEYTLLGVRTLLSEERLFEICLESVVWKFRHLNKGC